MSLVDLVGGVWIPSPMWHGGGVPAFTTGVTLDASTDKAATIVRAPRDLTADQVLVVLGAISTSNELALRLETVDTASNATPTGTLFAAGAEATNLTPAANTALVGTLTTPCAIAKGNLVALVAQPHDADAISLVLQRHDPTTIGPFGGQFPYGSYNTTGAYANVAAVLACAVHDADENKWVYLSELLCPVQSFLTAAINTGTGATTGTRAGVRFQVPFRGRLAAGNFKMSSVAAADFNVELYDNAGTLLETLISGVDSSQQRAATGANPWQLVFDNPYVIEPNTFYRCVVTPTTANSVTIMEGIFNAAAHLDALPGGQDFHATRFLNAGWTNLLDERNWMSLFFDQLDDGAGAGGGTASIFSTPIVRVA